MTFVQTRDSRDCNSMESLSTQSLRVCWVGLIQIYCPGKDLNTADILVYQLHDMYPNGTFPAHPVQLRPVATLVSRICYCPQLSPSMVLQLPLTSKPYDHLQFVHAQSI